MTYDELLKQLSEQKQILTTEDAINHGVPKSGFYQYIREQGYEKASHGMYVREGDLLDQNLVIHLRCPAAVFSHDEALYYHGLVDREPLQPTITIYTGYNTKRLVETGVKVYTVKKSLLDLGKIEGTNNFGNKIPVYDLERTICDLVRSRSNFEFQDFQAALKAYAGRKDKNLDRLMEYAELFHVKRLIRQYLEFLL